MGEPVDLGRRRFIVATAATGGGLALGFSAPLASAASVPTGDAAAAGAELSPWLTIGRDGVVTVRAATPESGNGVMTQMAMYVAEELPCDWSMIRTDYASTNRDVLEGGVYSRVIPKIPSDVSFFSGRSTTKERMETLLQVGASARERLRQAAADTWQVPVAEVEARDSRLFHANSGRSLGYGEVADRAAGVKLTQEPRIKPQSEWTLLGRKTPTKQHVPAVVNGTAQFGIDVRLPGMLYAALLQSPVMGGRIRRVDTAKASTMPGVKAVVVVDPDEVRPPWKLQPPDMDWDISPQAGIAVIADHYWQAKKALAAVVVEWDDRAGAKWKSDGQIVRTAEALVAQPGKPVTQVGNPDQAMPQQAKFVEATYHTPYCDHAMMEPLNGTALVTADRVDLWHPTSMTNLAHYAAAMEAGVPLEKVHVHQTLIGGQFGRRNFGDDVTMVVAVARKYPGRPIHVIWSREETTRQGRYRALNVVRLKAGLDKAGMPEALVARTAGRSFRPRNPPEEQLGFLSTGFGLYFSAYAGGAIPNTRIEYHDMPLHILAGPYRGPGYNSNAFILESFIDECAHAAGIDPLEYRLKIYTRWPDPGPTLCLKEAAAKAGWGKKLKPGMGQGIAVANWGSFGQPQAGTTVCAVATVEVSKKGVLRVHAIDLAFDCGRILNRDAVVHELTGGVIFGLNMTLNEELTVKDGRIVEGNFDQYPMLRMADMPQINIHFGGLSGHDRFAEIGEPAVGVIGPAIANAIFRATGRRIRSTPFRKHDLSRT
jgi:isoquinoline 1-oxidoreductase beta subunit